MEDEKFRNKYKTRSSRLSGYDYSQNGMYFVTICTKDREGFFGRIEGGKMVLSEVGRIADKYWQEISRHFPHVKLDIYQIMPNHVHGILEIIIENKNVETPNLGVSKFIHKETPGSGVSTGGNNIYWKQGCLGVIINQYKRACTMAIIKQLNPTAFAWQSRFYEHIIRNETSLNIIREYIAYNPETWERDRNNPENLYM